MSITFDLLQDEHHAEMIGEGVHRCLNPVILRCRGRSVLTGCVVQRHFAAPLAAAQSHEGDPGGYTLQPRDEAPALVVALQGFRKSYEHVMDDVLCVLAGANEAICQPEQRPSVLERSEERRVGKECRSRWSADH